MRLYTVHVCHFRSASPQHRPRTLKSGQELLKPAKWASLRRTDIVLTTVVKGGKAGFFISKELIGENLG